MIQAVWGQVRSWGARVGEVVSSQEVALTNARRASTQASRRRVEREAVEIYLDEMEPDTDGAQPPAHGSRTAADPRG